MLEKAVLEYAASATAHPKTRSTGDTSIAGFMDNHVWSMATQLRESGHVVATGPNGSPGVNVSEILEPGTVRLKELVAMQEAKAAAEKARLDDAKERANSKKWWKRSKGRTSA